MAIGKISTQYVKWGGLSGDVKPTTGISQGTEFTEIDTGAKYIFWNGTWEDDLTLIYAMKKAMES